MENLELRLFKTELRLSEPDKPDSRKFEGYAARFDSPSQPIGYYEPMIETIARGAFKRTLADNEQDVIWNYEHNDGKILGRKSSGTVVITEDEKGLKVSGEIPNTTYGNDIIESLKRNDLKYMSFAFVCRKDQRDNTVSPMKRTLLDVDLYDVSIVVNPAYLSTEANLRSINAVKVQKPYVRSAFEDNVEMCLLLSELQGKM